MNNIDQKEMSWSKVKIGSFLKERVGRFKPFEANSMGLKRIEKIDFSGTYHLVDKPTNTDMILVKKGDLLISGINAEKGAVTVYDDEQDAVATIHYSSYEFDKKKIDVEYFRWFLISDAFKTLLKETAGSGIKTELKPKHLLPLEIYLPGLSLQNEIVKSILQKHNKIINIQTVVEEQNNYLQQLRQSFLQEAVQGKLTQRHPDDEPASKLLERIKAEKQQLIAAGKLKKEKPLPPITTDETPFELPEGWVWCRLGEIITLMDAGWSPACKEKAADYDKWGVLKTTSVQSLEYLQNENKELPENLTPKKQYEVNGGDILITRAGPFNRVGICCLVKETRAKLMISDKLVRFHLVEKLINQEYIALSLNTGKSKDFIESKKSGMAASQVNISQDNLKLTPIPLPPLSEQQSIINKLQQLMQMTNQLEQQVQQSQIQAQQLLQEVLKEAFNPKEKEYTTNGGMSIAAED